MCLGAQFTREYVGGGAWRGALEVVVSEPRAGGRVPVRTRRWEVPDRTLTIRSCHHLAPVARGRSTARL